MLLSVLQLCIPVVVWLLEEWVFKQHQCGGDDRAPSGVLDGISREVVDKACSSTQQRGCHGCVVGEAVVDGVHRLEIDGDVAVADLCASTLCVKCVNRDAYAPLSCACVQRRLQGSLVWRTCWQGG